MIGLIFATALLLASFSSVDAERRILAKNSRDYDPGVSQIRVLDSNRSDGHRVEDRVNRKEYDQTNQEYVFTFYDTDGKEKEYRWDPPNKVDGTVACSVTYSAESAEYKYEYTIKIQNTSRQKAEGFGVDLLPSVVLRTEVPEGVHTLRRWRWTKADEESNRPKWAFFGFDGVEPGSELKVSIVSKQPPVVTTCYLRGLQRVYYKGAARAFMPGSGIPREDAVVGKTLGPKSPDGPSTDLAEFLDVAESWGWIAPSAKSRAESYVRRGITANSLTALKAEIRGMSQSDKESEVDSFIENVVSTQ